VTSSTKPSNRKPVAPLTDREADITIEDAYQIQLRMIQRRLDAGETIVGKKIGVTSKVVMDMLGVNQPDFGHLTSGMVFNEGEPSHQHHDRPAAEAEVAFMLKRDLQAPASPRPTCCAPPTA
jgi:2-oxopent-4-enoate/cis-2-oxohex-4-enoate hydratase